NYEAAIALAKENLGVLNKTRSRADILLLTLKLLSQIDSLDSSRYIKEYININDSLQFSAQKVRNKFARIEYETEEITDAKELAIKEKWIIAWSSLLIVLIGSLLFIIRLQRAKQKEMRL